MKSEYKFYLFAVLSLISGLSIAIINRSIPIALVSLVFAIGSSFWGYRTDQRLQDKQEVIEELLEDKQDLKEGLSRKSRQTAQFREKLTDEREEKEKLREAKKQKNRRLSNLKRALQRKGVDTEYLIEKYDRSLYAPLMVLTHFSAPNNNSEDDAEFITENLKALDTKMLHGSARIVPPRNFDQDVRAKGELREWFDENVLGGRTDLTHKLEVISVIDITKTFDRDASEKKEGPDFKTNTVSELFETDTVIPTEDLLDILSRSNRISLEQELRENIALLVVPSASEQQMEELVDSQTSLQESLGDLSQIAETPVDDIKTAFAQHGITDPQELAEGAKEEAERLKKVLS
ncbi:hypothetical protein EFA46_009100 [Halarchaeum sp. CBA1220]|uniref:hypothetical protein n=1 Tax=Halarchaeum sp. CBA1220 TaxID=1853682 RepID=UPI0011CDD631|nr:hypothetical protein [Halarchaeum sp. CBA1220]QLC34357.1 hypothetical protein EFA46_009100 [Halarchaeum sp. CBA1220]